MAKNKKFKAKKKHKKYSDYLKDYKNNPLVKTKVSLKVKGKKYTSKSNKKRKYKANVIFKGDNIYNGVCKKIKIIIK